MSKVLVTGGAGFIGSHLVDRLIKLKHQVTIIDDLSTGRLVNINNYAIFVKGSILNIELLKQIIPNQEYIFHLAAIPRIGKSIDQTLETNNVNVNGTLNLLEVVRKYNPKLKRFIYAGSSSVYGKQKSICMHEGMTPNPLSPYALQKYIAEKYGLLYKELFNIPFISLRFSNVFGERQLTPEDEQSVYALVIGKFIYQKNKGFPMTIYGTGKQTRSYVHVKDTVEGCVKAMSLDYSVSDNQKPIISLGSGVETDINQIAEMVGGKVKHIIPNPRGDFEEERKCVSFDKAKLLLDWEPKINIKDGIKRLL